MLRFEKDVDYVLLLRLFFGNFITCAFLFAKKWSFFFLVTSLLVLIFLLKTV